MKKKHVRDWNKIAQEIGISRREQEIMSGALDIKRKIGEEIHGWKLNDKLVISPPLDLLNPHQNYGH